MKKVFLCGFAALTVVLAAVVWLVPRGNGTATHKVAIASGHEQQRPIMFRVGDEIHGVGPDLVKMIFDDVGVESAYPYVGTWSEVQDKAKTGDVDVIVAAYKTEERQKYLLYTDAFYPDTSSVFVRADRAFAYDKWEDLIGKKGLITEGDSYGQAFDEFRDAKLTVSYVPNSAAAFAKLDSGEADYFVYATLAGDRELAAWSGGKPITRLPHPLVTEDFYIAISKLSPFAKYLGDFNRLIATYKADGTIDRLLAKYHDAQD